MKDLTEGKEYKLILLFALPMLLGNIFQQLYNIVDSIIVGRYIGKQALAAVGASFPIIFLLISLIVGFSIGGTILISQYFGAKQYDKVRKAVDTLNIVLFSAAFVIGGIGIYFTREIFQLISLPNDVIEDAVKYLKVYLTGLPFAFGFYGVSAILRGVGDSKTPLVFLIISTVINIILDIVFVIVFHYGIKGVAFATVISQFLALLSAIIWLNKKNKMLSFRIKGVKFDTSILKKSLKIGVPSGIQQVAVSLGMMIIMVIVNSFGTNVIAGYSSAMRIDSLAILPAMMFSTAFSTFVGQNIGANKLLRVKKGYTSTLLMTSFVSIFTSIIIISFANNLMQLFTTDKAVIDVGVNYLMIVSSFYIIFSFMFTTQAVMRGAGDTLIPMAITIIALWIVRIPLAYMLSDKYGDIGIWWSMPVAWSVGATLSFIYYLTGRWKQKKIVNTSN